MAIRSQTQRALLFTLIGSIVCCALAGIYCLLLGHMGSFEARVLGTTGVFGAGSILGMASAVSWERRRWHPVGLLGQVAVAIAVVLAMIAIWFDPRWAQESFYKTLAITAVFAVALPHVGLLALARLRRQYEWVRVVTVGGVALLAGEIVISILLELVDEEWFRLMGSLAIVAVAGTMAVPILHRISGIRAREEIQTSALTLSLQCPRCGHGQRLPIGRSKCTQCGLGFSIEIQEAHCRQCGYPLHQLRSAVCPECGTPIAHEHAPA